MNTPEVTLRALVSAAKLTVAQVKNYLDHYNYKLKGSQIVLLNNDRERPENIDSGTLTGVDEHGDISFLPNGGEEKTMRLGAKIIMIIFKDDKAQYVVCGV